MWRPKGKAWLCIMCYCQMSLFFWSLLWELLSFGNSFEAAFISVQLNLPNVWVPVLTWIIPGTVCASSEHLKLPLEEYMLRLPKVRILRTKKREGLIRTRLLGAALAKGQVITFLDSHCEANVNWLPPLLGEDTPQHHCIHLHCVLVLMVIAEIAAIK